MKGKTLTSKDVEQVMLRLIDENEQTTTLEVKQELRNLGFWATQAEVSQMMNALSENSAVEFENAGGFRVYTEAIGGAVDYSKQFRVTTATPGSAVVQTYEQHEVWDKDDESSSLVIPAKSRHAARNEYSKLFNVPYRDTRSRKV